MFVPFIALPLVGHLIIAVADNVGGHVRLDEASLQSGGKAKIIFNY